MPDKIDEKIDEISEKFRRGGGFSIQKFMLIFAIIDDTLVMNFGNKLQVHELQHQNPFFVSVPVTAVLNI